MLDFTIIHVEKGFRKSLKRLFAVHFPRMYFESHERLPSSSFD